MIDDKRLTTLKALQAHLASEITIANGYQHDMGGIDAVIRGRITTSDGDPLPQLSVLEPLNPDRFPARAGDSEDFGGFEQHEGWILLIQGWVEDDKDYPTDAAYRLMADTKKALSKLKAGPSPMTGAGAHASYRLGGLIDDIQIEPGTVRPPDENSAKAYFYLRISLGFSETISDPYDLS